MQIGRSIQAYDDLLDRIKLLLMVGLPVLMVLVGMASWGIAGFAMQPIYFSYRQMQQFTADAAHELRTPLASILATLEASLSAALLEPGEAQRTLQTLQRQVIRLTQLAQDLLFLAKLEQFKPDFTKPDFTKAEHHQANTLPNPVNLQNLLSDLEEELAPLALEQVLQFQLECSVAVLVWVWGDESQLYRLFINLITNALQYTPPSGWVRVKLSQAGRFALVQIEDSGIGLRKTDQQRIFERFYRVATDRSRQTGGTGLGLPIAQAIVQAHRGTIQVQSELGKGSIFTVRLPIVTRLQSAQDFGGLG